MGDPPRRHARNVLGLTRCIESGGVARTVFTIGRSTHTPDGRDARDRVRNCLALSRELPLFEPREAALQSPEQTWVRLHSLHERAIAEQRGVQSARLEDA